MTKPTEKRTSLLNKSLSQLSRQPSHAGAGAGPSNPASAPVAPEVKASSQEGYPDPVGTASHGTAPASASPTPSTLNSMDVTPPKKAVPVRHDDVLKHVLVTEIVEGTNPRTDLDEEAFQDLLASVRLQGVQQPIILRYFTDPARPHAKYQLVAGYRRFRATLAAEKTSIPAIIKPMSDAMAYLTAVTENTNRDDMTPADTLLSYEHLVMLQAQEDIPRQAIVAAIGGAAKTSKLKKISESAYWRDQVLRHGASIRAAYEGAVEEQQQAARSAAPQPSAPAVANPAAASPHHSMPTSPAEGAFGSAAAPTQAAPAPASTAAKRGKKRKCLEATYMDGEGKRHTGYVSVADLAFNGDGALYVTWHSHDGAKLQIALSNLQFTRGFLL